MPRAVESIEAFDFVRGEDSENDIFVFLRGDIDDIALQS